MEAHFVSEHEGTQINLKTQRRRRLHRVPAAPAHGLQPPPPDANHAPLPLAPGMDQMHVVSNAYPSPGVTAVAVPPAHDVPASRRGMASLACAAQCAKQR